jgi:uncharacterized RDD family membrane protein YckC
VRNKALYPLTLLLRVISGGALMFIVAPAIFVSGLLTLFIDAGIAQADAVINFVEKVHGGEDPS